MLAGERRNLRVDRRDFDRDDFDLGLLQRGQIALQPVLGVVLAQERLAEIVDVHPHAFVAAGAQMLGQEIGLGGQDDVGRLLLHLVFDERHRDAGQIGAERLEALEQRAVERAEEAGHALHVENVDQLIGGAGRPLRAKGLVGELRERRLVVRRVDHAIELGLLAALLRRLQLGGPPAQRCGQAAQPAALRAAATTMRRAKAGKKPRLLGGADRCDEVRRHRSTSRTMRL